VEEMREGKKAVDRARDSTNKYWSFVY